MNPKSFALKKKVTNAVGSLLSAPSRAKQALRGSRFTREINVLKEARKYKGAPDFNGGEITDAFKVRSVADGIRSKYKKGGVK